MKFDIKPFRYLIFLLLFTSFSLCTFVINDGIVSDENPKNFTLSRKPALILDVSSLQSRKGAMRAYQLNL